MRAAGEEPPDEVLHALRIQGKRLRYTGELVATRSQPERKPVRQLVESTVALQEVLGDHQDACVAQERIRDVAFGGDHGAGVQFVAGRMVEREHVRAQHMRTLWWTAWCRVAAVGKEL